MRYLDTGSRDAEQTLARWFEMLNPKEMTSLRIQSGFFSADSLGLIAPLLEHCRSNDFPTHILIGSNDGGTLRDSVIAIADLMDVNRKNSKLGVISFRGGYYHPKAYHLSRVDGSHVAFVGSANLTGPGLAQHIEAGIAFDSSEGDSKTILDSISTSVDSWFDEERDGLRVIICPGEIKKLVDEGILAIAPPQRTPLTNSSGPTGSTRPALSPLVKIPQLPKSAPPAAGSGATAKPIKGKASPTTKSAPTTSATTHTGGVPRSGYPPYLLFDSKATTPTSGTTALSGATLPNGAAGLIIKLNKDSARHFAGMAGTANVSIPVATLSTFCFGISQGMVNGNPIERPRAEFDLYLRYVSDTKDIKLSDPARTGIMAYGMSKEESGHGDIRLLVPAKTKDLTTLIKNAGHTVPSDGSLALLQWPEASDPTVGLIFLDPSSVLYAKVKSVYEAAESAEEIVGKGACWLPSSLIPPW